MKGADLSKYEELEGILTGSGKFVEIHGTAEQEPFSKDELNALMALAESGIADLTALQKAAEAVQHATVNQRQWFPKGSGPEAGKTRALPEIWARPEDFKAAQKVFSDVAPKLLAAANAGDIDTKLCKACASNEAYITGTNNSNVH